MVRPLKVPSLSRQDGRLITPSEAEWDALTPAQREQVEHMLIADLVEAADEEIASLSETDISAMAEGDWHDDLRTEAKATLRRYFENKRSIYIGANLGVFYPRKRGFSPDLMAVLDVSPHKRSSWLVRNEGKGLDLALEICHHGKRRKDLIDNVARYAKLGIREYFILDVGLRHLRGLRLPRGTARTYQEIPAKRGRYHSEILGLDIAYVKDRLRFYVGHSVLRTAEEKNEEMSQAVQEATERALAAEEQTEAAQEQTEAAQEQTEAAFARLAKSLLTILRLRGLDVSQDVRARITSCRDLALLDRWLERAATIATIEGLFFDS